jgi:uncharacterized membrane protein YkvA (DUF1232 family)
MRVDLIPGATPIIGKLDDAVIVHTMMFFAFILIPKDVIAEHRKKVYGED